MIFIVMGPSGSGKTLVGEYLKKKGIKELVSHTTRKPRKGEADGVAYHFVDEADFLATEKVEESIYAGHHYGVSKAEVERKSGSGDVFAVTDINGARAFRRIYGNQVMVLYIHTSMRKMRERMRKRGDTKEGIRKRMRNFRNTDESVNRLYADFILYNNTSKKSLFRSVDHAVKCLKNAQCFPVR